MERLTELITNSRIFDYFRVKNNVHKEFQNAAYGVTIGALLKDLPHRHQALLNSQHWHNSDPNQDPPTVSVSLLYRLVNDACFQCMGFKIINTKLYIHDVGAFASDVTRDEEVFAKLITEINEVWEKQGIAKISYAEKHLHFEILLKPNK